ncbi:cation:proton antiporter [Synechococcus sp. HK01-R]|jgi:Kef-type K+ transport system membrane component KefB/nucleotide-binding universal stress UspA family protein|uniref:cation:proton antiporter domain-containing protein n=1 Tax=Synechococcus sp. HK01-R TaxID=2751171 RepID=UPI0016240C04|nr:cation:proton antiporter [Synechococcus sp. HK01-R]QNG26398.1 cation:proton antiporter [Synechococcus sp. HK01-R]
MNALLAAAAPSGASIAHLTHHPLGIFALLVAIAMLVPPIFRKTGLPDLVGLLIAGMLVGPNALNWLQPNGETITLFSDIGAIYLLFIVGLEIDLDEFNRVKSRSLTLGVLHFLFGMATGISIGLLFNFPMVPSILIGTLIATHTPLGYPIIRSYGAQRDESVIVSIGSTILTDIASLLVLAIAMGLGKGSFSATNLASLIASVSLFAVIVVFSIRTIGGKIFKQSINDENRIFLAVLLTLFIASLGAELAGVEKIAGAFLAGLAINSVLPEGKAKQQVIFVGGALFIPIFFIHLGLLIDFNSLRSSFSSIELTALMVVGVIACKGLVSVIAGRGFGYNGNQMVMMWSLAMPQVAATLAAAFVGYEAGLLNASVLNGVLAMMVVTASLGPALTARSVTQLVEPEDSIKTSSTNTSDERNRSNPEAADFALPVVSRPLKIVVPVANPATEYGLLSMASRLLNGGSSAPGQLLPMALVCPSLEEARGSLNRAVAAARDRLNEAASIGEDLKVPTRCLLRLDEDIAGGMSRSALEQGADLLLIGTGQPDKLRNWLFGDLVDGVCRTAHCPVVVVNLAGQGVDDLQRILVPIKDLSASAREQFELAQRLLASAEGSSGVITLLHIVDPRFSRHDRQWIERELRRWQPPGESGERIRIDLVPGPGIDQTIQRSSRHHDLVILRSQRRRVAGLPIPASDRTSSLIRQLKCPTLVISEPLL